jgi:hypothetical protein
MLRLIEDEKSIEKHSETLNEKINRIDDEM